MGATEFSVVGEGGTHGEAFRNAVEQAQYDYGHAGYTGTIAEKEFEGYVVIYVQLPLEEAEELAWHMLENDNPLISDKWGPAGCIPLTDGNYLFFGWASS